MFKPSSRRRLAAVGICLTALGVPAVAAASTPATVNLRIEGPTSTLYEGRVTADVAPFRFTGDPVAHACDGTAGGGGGSSATPVTVRNNAITAATGPLLSYTGDWFSFGAAFKTINGTNVAYDGATNKYLVEYKNGQVAGTGGCSDPIATGDDVLFAYGEGTEPLLGLSGPATAPSGKTATLTVSELGTPTTRISGASVGSATSGTDGTVTVGPLVAGPNTFKATRAGAIRSNAFTVCATNGADGFCGPTPCQTNGSDGRCGAPDKTAPVAAIAGVKERAVFSRAKAPTTFRGKVAADPSGLKDVRLRLTRTRGPHCYHLDSKLERLVTSKVCGVAGGRFFSIGSNAAWSYLLPFRLPVGRYVLDVQAVDKAGNTSTVSVRGRDRVVLVVR
jgi:hypothetical protein